LFSYFIDFELTGLFVVILYLKSAHKKKKTLDLRGTLFLIKINYSLLFFINLKKKKMH